jgi:hypothetical protein
MKVSELTGALLDYWVANAEGKIAAMEKHTDPAGNMRCCIVGEGQPYNPSTNLDHLWSDHRARED